MEVRVVDVLDRLAPTEPYDTALRARYSIMAYDTGGGVWHASIVGGHGHSAAVPTSAAGKTANEAIDAIVQHVRQQNDQLHTPLELVEHSRE